MRVVCAFAVLCVAAMAQEAAKEAEAPAAVDYSKLRAAQDEAQKLRAAEAMKFQQARVDAAAEATTEAAKAEVEMAAKAGAGAGAQTFKVEPAQEEGTEIKPAPGQNDAPVKVRNADDYMEPVTATTEYLGSATFESNIKGLLEEIDQSENKVKGLKLRLVEKENFVDSLAKREDMLQDDVSKDKQAVENLHAHIKALKARIERVKKEKQLRLLEAQFHEYSAAAKRIGDQASELSRIKSLIYNKMKGLVGEIKPLRSEEDVNMAESIDVQPDAKEAEAVEAAEDAEAAAEATAEDKAEAGDEPTEDAQVSTEEEAAAPAEGEEAAAAEGEEAAAPAEGEEAAAAEGEEAAAAEGEEAAAPAEGEEAAAAEGEEAAAEAA